MLRTHTRSPTSSPYSCDASSISRRDDRLGAGRERVDALLLLDLQRRLCFGLALSLFSCSSRLRLFADAALLPVLGDLPLLLAASESLEDTFDALVLSNEGQR